MNKAFKAFSPQDKMYNINRINSKLINYSSNKNIMNNQYENKLTILSAVSELKQLVNCFAVNKDCKRQQRYLESIIQLENRLNQGEFNNIKPLFCYMAGTFERFRSKHKKHIKSLCEKEYHAVCIPLYKMELEKKAPNTAYSK